MSNMKETAGETAIGAARGARRIRANRVVAARRRVFVAWIGADVAEVINREAAKWRLARGEALSRYIRLAELQRSADIAAARAASASGVIGREVA